MRLNHKTFISLLSILMVNIMSNAMANDRNAKEPLVFISAFTAGKEAAIHAYRLNPSSGHLTFVSRTADCAHPFFMALSPNGDYLYAIHALEFGGKEDEQVAAYRLDKQTGQLQLLNRQSTRGTASCYLAVDATGKTLLVANYATGSIAALPIRADGSLDPAASFIQHHGSSIDPDRQKGPFAHCIIPSPDNQFAFAADLGIDKILCYRLAPATAKLSLNLQPFVRTPTGAGPRHLTFHPNSKYLYAINELKNSITQFDYLPDTGILIERHTISTLPDDFTGTSHCADLKITPDGRFLYGTNRGHDSIAAFAIGEGGTLTLIEIKPSGGKGPQNLAIAADGRLLVCANMPGDNVVVFQIDTATGKLRAVDQPVSMPRPSCIMLVR